MADRPRSDLTLCLIAAFKLVKAGLLFLVGAGVLTLARNGDAQSELGHWLGALKLDPGNHHFDRLLAAVGAASPTRLHELSAGTFFYATVFLVEGVGLALRQRWAEYLTVVVTGSFIPIEIYELVRKPTVPRALSIPLNVAIVVYLVVRIRRERAARTSPRAPSTAHPAP